MFIAETRRKFINFCKTLGLAAGVFYFTYYMISGQNGALALLQLQGKVAAAHAQFTQVDAERMHLEKRVNLMYATSLDADLLDEQTRKTLGRAGADEYIYMPDSVAR